MKNLSILILALFIFSCSNGDVKEAQEENTEQTEVVEKTNKNLEGFSRAYFASGCFWCVEAIFESVVGVEEAISGYSGGKEENPSYSQVSAGLTGHTESVEVYYDPEKIDYKTLVNIYYGSHNPTTVNGQAPDFGRQYRSAIFYQNDEEKMIAEAYKDSLDQSGIYEEPIATEIVPLGKFYQAEDYHQNYEKLHPNQSYVKNVSIPRLNRFKKKYPELLKENTH